MRVSIGPGVVARGDAFSCESLDEFSTDSEAERELQQNSGVRMEWVRNACDVRSAAYAQLSAVRADALLDWLKKEIREREG
jgi:hypothetical protein